MTLELVCFRSISLVQPMPYSVFHCNIDLYHVTSCTDTQRIFPRPTTISLSSSTCFEVENDPALPGRLADGILTILDDHSAGGN